MPMLWKAGMVILVVCLLASMAIAIVRLSTTPSEILGDGYRGLSKGYVYERADGTKVVAGPER